MTFDASASHNGKTGWYKVQIPTAYLKAKFFINDGTAGTPINGANASAEKVVNEGVVVAPTPNPTPNPQNLDVQY